MPGIITSSVMATGRNSFTISSACGPLWPRQDGSPPAAGNAASGLVPWDRRRSREPCLGLSHRQLRVDARSGGIAATGRRMLKVDPFPGLLVSVISPPIISQKRFVIASPDRYRHTSATGLYLPARTARKRLTACSSGMPIPVSVTRNSHQSVPPDAKRDTCSRM